jgi:ferredoxin, 2Fe-2S
MRVAVIDREGNTSHYQLSSLQDLYEDLVDRLKIDGICGGACSCATCHVYVLNGAELLQEMDYTERDVLEGLMHQTPKSRLLCQTSLRASQGDITFEIAPEE